MKESRLVNDIIERMNAFVSLLTDKQINELKENIAIERFKKNEVIYREGEVPQYMHCLMNGKVKLYKEGVGRRMQILRLIKPFEFFGYRAYLANENYVNSAGAFETCTICMIPIELVEEWINTNNDVAMFFIKLLAGELGASDQRTVNLTQKHIRGRLAEALLFLIDSYGYEEDGATISIYLSREDLANLSNMTTSNAIRTLSAFATENIIAVDGRKIKIINADRLKSISKIG